MRLDPKSLTTPKKIDQHVKAFCRSLSDAEPVFVSVAPEPWCRQSCCEMNVEKLIEQVGGEPLFGFKIWYVRGKYIEGERHVVLKLEGELRDPTFNSDGETMILFVPDSPQNSAFDDRAGKVRRGISNKAKKLAAELDARNRKAHRLNPEDSWNTMLTYEQWQAGQRMPSMWYGKDS